MSGIKLELNEGGRNIPVRRDNATYSDISIRYLGFFEINHAFSDNVQ